MEIGTTWLGSNATNGAVFLNVHGWFGHNYHAMTDEVFHG